jgi:hypothetical protein
MKPATCADMMSAISGHLDGKTIGHMVVHLVGGRGK